MRKGDLVNSAMVAAMMADQWSNETLLSRTWKDLCQSYGCSKEAAERILKDELTKRKLSGTNKVKEFE